MKTQLFTFMTLTLALSLRAFAHGEDKLGPHKGYIRMPGAFHTEVVPKSKDIRVYLLDLQWKNPTTVNSSVRTSFDESRQNPVTCQESQDKTYFTCPLPAGFKLSKKGVLIVQASRDGQPGSEATYNLPLKLQSSEASTPRSGHGQH